MYKRIISFIVLFSLLAQLGCGTMYDISKEEFTRRYANQKVCPSIRFTSFNSKSYKVAYDSYYLNSDTIYYGVKFPEDGTGKYLYSGTFALQDIESIEIAETNLLLGPVVFLVGAIVFIGIVYLVVALGGPLMSWN